MYVSDNPNHDWSLKMVAPLEPGIVCVDIERMLAFYTDILGLTFATDAVASAEMSTEFGTGPDGFRIIRLQTSYGERIKLVQPKNMALRKSAIPKWVFARQGITYLTFIVADVFEVSDKLKGHNVKMMSKGPVEIRKGIQAVFTCDPEGNFLEFVQYADLAAYRPDLFNSDVLPEAKRPAR